MSGHIFAQQYYLLNATLEAGDLNGFASPHTTFSPNTVKINFKALSH